MLNRSGDDPVDVRWFESGDSIDNLAVFEPSQMMSSYTSGKRGSGA